MESIRVLVRDAARTLQGTVSLDWAATLVAAIEADPETIAEFDQALQRFQIHAPLDAWRSAFESNDADPLDESPTLILDLPNRLIFSREVDADWSDTLVGTVFERGQPRELGIAARLPKTWQVVDGIAGWRERSESAARERALAPAVDERHALYDAAPDWLASALVAARAAGKTQPVVEIHAAWLSTPRDDLGRRTPRESLIEQIDEIEEQLGRRRNEWAHLRRPPSALPRGSRAYREGGVGLHEFIIYYDLVRHLLREGWQRLEEQPRGADELAAWMRDEQRRWLDQRIDDGGPGIIVPADVIDCERRRIPYTGSDDHPRSDDECRLCHPRSDSQYGPRFIHFTPGHFDYDFVFSQYKRREEWELDYGELAEN